MKTAIIALLAFGLIGLGTCFITYKRQAENTIDHYQQRALKIRFEKNEAQRKINILIQTLNDVTAENALIIRQLQAEIQRLRRAAPPISKPNGVTDARCRY